MDIQNNKLMSYWLFLAVSAVAIAGLYSIMLVLLRTPILYDFIPYKDFFRSALIVHVDLSVLVWFCAIQSALIGLYFYSNISLVMFILAAFGASMLAISPLYEGLPFMNNYVPILQNFLFAFGLALFACSVLINNVHFLYRFIISNIIKKLFDQNCFYALTSAMITLAAIICIYVAYYKLQQTDHIVVFGAQDYFEKLFWGGGHILQFMYVQLMQFAWLILYGRVSGKDLVQDKMLIFIAFINVALILPLLIISSKLDIASVEYTLIFTIHMCYFAGISSSLLAVYLIFKMIKSNNLDYYCFEYAALVSSMVLFFSGGVMSFWINDSNTIIPAHYHGSIIGITIALMGLVYLYLTRLNFHFSKNRFIKLIPYFYCVGQMMHITGLAVSGGYGALRKTPGEALSAKATTALGFMGAGGLLALIGGLLFVYICYSAFFRKCFQESN
jgi:cytochrome c oxidase subunit 1